MNNPLLFEEAMKRYEANKRVARMNLPQHKHWPTPWKLYADLIKEFGSDDGWLRRKHGNGSVQ